MPGLLFLGCPGLCGGVVLVLVCFSGVAVFGTEVGAALTKVLGVTESDFSNLALLTIICNVSSLLPLVFIGWLDGVGDESQEEMEAKQINGGTN